MNVDGCSILSETSRLSYVRFDDPAPIPAERRPSSCLPDTPSPSCLVPGGRLRVLVVDDSLAVLDLVSELIESLPFARVVGKAVSGSEAIKLVGELHPHAVVMDLAMPGLNGLEATRSLRARPDAPAVVLMSAYEQEFYDEAARDAGATAFCPKSELFTLLPVLLRSLAVARGFGS
jgi:CheY-like chemotaxis protein